VGYVFTLLLLLLLLMLAQPALSAGAVGFHIHWGIGGHPTDALGQPNTGVQTNFAFNVSGTACTSQLSGCFANASIT
jgi:hypothetical protein